MKGFITMVLTIYLISMVVIVPTYAWENGGSDSYNSSNPNSPRYGVHDFLLQKAVDMLPSNMRSKIDLTAAYYGTELPDYANGVNNTVYCPLCLRDRRNHVFYFNSDGSVQSDNAAMRSQQEYNNATDFLRKGDKYNFSIRVGMMSHYISDVSQYGHTSKTANVTHQGQYENYVELKYKTLYNDSIVFDGFEDVDAYNATSKLAYDTTFDTLNDGAYNNVWMDQDQNFLGSMFVARNKQSINYNINLVADVIHTLINTSPPIKGDVLSYYRGLGQYSNIVETSDLLKAADDWRDNIIPPGFYLSITTSQLLVLADEWRNA